MTLLAVQRDFQARIIETGETESAQYSRFEAGMAVYRNAYRARLVACLRETYDKTWSWIGDDSFDAAAAHHLILNPPTNWTLDDVGKGFPETLKQLFPNDPEVEELAWLEWEMQQVFVAPDSPKMDGVAFAETTLHFDHADWAGMRLSFAPEIRMRSVATAAARIWDALFRSETPLQSMLLPSAEALLVWREGLRPCFRQLEEMEYTALDRMIGGASFGEICALLAQGEAESSAAEMAGTMLGRWIGDQLVIGVTA